MVAMINHHVFPRCFSFVIASIYQKSSRMSNGRPSTIAQAINKGLKANGPFVPQPQATQGTKVSTLRAFFFFFHR
jgi:hypothetical protein